MSFRYQTKSKHFLDEDNGPWNSPPPAIPPSPCPCGTHSQEVCQGAVDVGRIPAIGICGTGRLLQGLALLIIAVSIGTQQAQTPCRRESKSSGESSCCHMALDPTLCSRCHCHPRGNIARDSLGGISTGTSNKMSNHLLGNQSTIKIIKMETTPAPK